MLFVTLFAPMSSFDFGGSQSQSDSGDGAGISVDVSASFGRSSLDMGKTNTALSDELGAAEQSTAVIPIETAYLKQLKVIHRARARELS
jgi:hypothetical protein